MALGRYMPVGVDHGNNNGKAIKQNNKTEQTK